MEKKHEQTKELFTKTKEMLEARIEQALGFEDKLTILNDELRKAKTVHEENRRKMVEEIGATKADLGEVKTNLNLHQGEFSASLLNNQFFQDQNQQQLKAVEKNVEHYKTFTDAKIEQMSFDIDRRVRVEDMRQNFKQLRDILLVKFKQLEDTKEATRGLITFQKFFHRIQTQQLISENLMALRVAREDRGFMNFQKKVYDELNERTRLECKMAARIPDYDLKNHLEQLEAYSLKQNDFMPFALKDVEEDYVGELLYKYL